MFDARESSSTRRSDRNKTPSVKVRSEMSDLSAGKGKGKEMGESGKGKSGTKNQQSEIESQVYVMGTMEEEPTVPPTMRKSAIQGVHAKAANKDSQDERESGAEATVIHSSANGRLHVTAKGLMYHEGESESVRSLKKGWRLVLGVPEYPKLSEEDLYQLSNPIPFETPCTNCILRGSRRRELSSCSYHGRGISCGPCVDDGIDCSFALTDDGLANFLNNIRDSTWFSNNGISEHRDRLRGLVRVRKLQAEALLATDEEIHKCRASIVTGIRTSASLHGKDKSFSKHGPIVAEDVSTVLKNIIDIENKLAEQSDMFGYEEDEDVRMEE